jgi:hypothetical protein
MFRPRVAARLGAALTVAALSAGLAACSLPDVSMSPGVSMPTSAPRTSEAARPTLHEAAATPTRASGELDSGSVTHAQKAGARTVVIDYWTEELAAKWRAQDPKTLQVAAHIEGGGTEERVKVTRFVVTLDDGTSRTTAAEDRGEFMITPPYSYSTALNLAPSDADASELALYVQIELLVETAPDSQQYFRQTVLDTLRLPMNEEIDQ